MTKLKHLHAQKARKFSEICAFAARELGLSGWPLLASGDRRRVEDEANQYVSEWEETVEMRPDPAIRPITPLRRLLSQYHQICERILDEQDIEVGLWAYKRGAKRRRPAASH
jgi:hypothetical protein